MIGSSLYPTGSAGDGRVRTVPHSTKKNDMYRCRQCGMGCLTTRVQSPGGDDEGTSLIQVTEDVYGTPEPLIGVGFCPFCASPNNRRI